MGKKSHHNLSKTFLTYETLATFRAEEILPLIEEAMKGGEEQVVRSIDWFHPLVPFQVNEPRLFPFVKSLVCYKCGRTGTFFALQRTIANGKWKKWHINLYAPGGHLMSCDHLVAKSEGGTNDPENLGTLCQRCNSRKGSKSVEEFLELKYKEDSKC